MSLSLRASLALITASWFLVWRVPCNSMFEFTGFTAISHLIWPLSNIWLLPSWAIFISWLHLSFLWLLCLLKYHLLFRNVSKMILGTLITLFSLPRTTTYTFCQLYTYDPRMCTSGQNLLLRPRWKCTIIYLLSASWNLKATLNSTFPNTESWFSLTKLVLFQYSYSCFCTQEMRTHAWWIAHLWPPHPLSHSICSFDLPIESEGFYWKWGFLSEDITTRVWATVIS